MVSEKKKKIVKEVESEIKKYSVIGLINMHKLPAKQLYEIREKLRGRAVIKMIKKRLIKLALERTKLNKIYEYLEGEPAILLSNEDPFELAKIIKKSKSMVEAKAGDVVDEDIIVLAGPTQLTPGPVIGEFQKAKIPAGVEAGKIAVKKDTLVVKAGDEVAPHLAGLLMKLGIKPMEIGLNLLAAHYNGIIYPKEILFVDIEEYVENLKKAYLEAFNLSLNIEYFTPENISLLLSKAHQEALSLATSANILTKETVKPLLSKAYKVATNLDKLTKGPG